MEDLDWDEFLAVAEVEGTDGHFVKDDEQECVQEMDRENEDEQRVSHELRELDIRGPTDSPGSESRPSVALAPDVRREIYRIHRNLGHPETRSFCRALKHAGVRQDIIRYVKNEFSCPICSRRRRPQPHRPAHLGREMGFNEVVGIDLVFFRKIIMMNVLCWGTSYQWVEAIPDRRSETVTQAFMCSWVGHYGTPKLIVADQGREFTGQPFVDRLSEAGCIVHFIDARAPWQNSRTEKAGGVFKEKLAKVVDEATVIDGEEMKIAVAETLWTRNMYYDRSGHSPHQRVFGSTPRVPMSMLSDDMIDRELVLGGASDAMKRAMDIRQQARKAWMEQQDQAAISRAGKANTRSSDANPTKAGDVVYVWRETSEYRGWSGPGIIVAESPNGRSLWISLRGYLIKAAREQVRQATSEEHLGAELAKVVSQEMLESLESGNLKNFRDVEKEGGPPERLRDDPSGALERIDEEDMEMYEPSIPEPAEENAARQQDVNMDHVEEQQDSLTSLDMSTREPSENMSAPSQPSQPPSRRLSGVRINEGSHGPFYGPRHVETTTPRPMPYPFSATTPSLPAPPGPSHYFEVLTTDEHGVREGDPQRMRTRQAKKHYHTVASTEEKFETQNAMALFNRRDKLFYLTKKKESPGQITFSELSPDEKRIFRQSRAKEVKSLLDSGAITILSLKDSLRFAKEHPDFVLTSRYVDRYKPEDGVTFPTDFDVGNITPEFRAKLGPKSRWCVVGWKDPMVHAVERSAPTPLTISMYLFMQLAATRHWPAWAKDVKTAFLQGKPTTRQQKLACRMPSDEAFEGYDPRQLIQLETEVYGLCSGPSWWRRSLCEILVRELGYRINAYDRCVLTLDGIPEDGEEELSADNAVIRGIKKDGPLLPTQGIIVVEVDDLLEAGGPPPSEAHGTTGGSHEVRKSAVLERAARRNFVCGSQSLPRQRLGLPLHDGRLHRAEVEASPHGATHLKEGL